MDNTIVLGGLAAVPIITALLQVLKPLIPATWVARLTPAAAVAIGVGWNVGLAASTGELNGTTPFLGVVVGLAAAGLYSAARPVGEALSGGPGGASGGGP